MRPRTLALIEAVKRAAETHERAERDLRNLKQELDAELARDPKAPLTLTRTWR